ncbi:MAG: helix-turn-helix transcriptional regulator, partial [Acidobacteria bacterium]|nr:helix-turn-helix transcriptional regulator [Acidobacteriota bacterium]
ERSGLTRAMVSAYEAGKASPSLGSLSVYLGAIQRDLGDLQDEVNRLSGRFIDEPPGARERAVGRAILKALEHMGDEAWFALRLKGRETTTKED